MPGCYLILTVGRTPALLEKTINDHQPDGVVMIASPDTVKNTEAIELVMIDRLSKVVVVTNAEDLDACYNTALDAFNIVMQFAQGQATIIADFTGGTKVMSVGLALALNGKGVSWSYVSGKRHNDQAGRAIDGEEVIKTLAQ